MSSIAYMPKANSARLAESRPWPLRVFTLGRCVVERNGASILENGGGGKPLEFLMLLIALGRNGLSERRVEEILWPDSDAPDKSFAITLHRLRQLVGSKVLILKDKRIRLNRSLCWVDAWAFEELLDKKNGNNGNGFGPRIETWQEVIDLYQGDFLAGEPDAAWNIQLKVRLKDRFLRHLLFLSDLLESQGNTDDAMHCLQRGVEADPLAEAFYQRLMKGHHRRGQYAELEKTYRLCQRMLATELGVEPSEETRRIHDSLSGMC